MTSPVVLDKLSVFKTKNQAITTKQTREERLLSGSVLECMLNFAPNANGRTSVEKAITGCRNDEELHVLGKYYRDNFILPMRASGGHTPAPSEHPSRSSIELEREDIDTQIEDENRDLAELKKLTLERDGNRCVVTGYYDLDYAEANPDKIPQDAAVEQTTAAHILPFSLEYKRVQIKNSATVWQIIQDYSGIKLSELNGDEINRLENVFTLPNTVHNLFGALKLYFDPVENQPNSYHLCKTTHFWPVPYLREGIVVTFKSINRLLPLPDPQYLALHAACAKIAHTSGAAETIDSFLSDYEEMPVLARDGSSSEVLWQALALASTQVTVS